MKKTCIVFVKMAENMKRKAVLLPMAKRLIVCVPRRHPIVKR